MYKNGILTPPVSSITPSLNGYASSKRCKIKIKACVLSYGEDNWLVKTSMRLRIFTKMSAPRCDKIGYALTNQILFGVTPKNQKRSKRADTREVTPKN